MRVTETEEREKERQKFGHISTTPPKKKTVKRETHQTSSRINAKRSTSKHITLKIWKDKQTKS